LGFAGWQLEYSQRTAHALGSGGILTLQELQLATQQLKLGIFRVVAK
jgi:hypothetical protein